LSGWEVGVGGARVVRGELNSTACTTRRIVHCSTARYAPLCLPAIRRNVHTFFSLCNCVLVLMRGRFCSGEWGV
jgi:hypothetical protein